MSSFSTWMRRAHLSQLVVGHVPRYELHRAAFHVLEASLVPVEPVMGLLRQDLDRLLRRAGVSRWQVQVVPVDATAHLVDGRVPGMMGVGEAHPAEPVLGRVQGVEPGDGAVGDPVRVVHPPRHGIVLDLGGVGVAAALVVKAHAGEVDERVEGVEPLRAVWPRATCRSASSADSRASPARRGRSRGRARSSPALARRFSVHLPSGSKAGLEMRLAHQRGAVPAVSCRWSATDGASTGRGTPLAGDAMGAHVLPGDHRRARRRAHRVLVVGPVVDGCPRPRGASSDRGAGDGVAGTPEGVVALLVGGDEEDLAAHGDPIGWWDGGARVLGARVSGSPAGRLGSGSGPAWRTKAITAAARSSPCPPAGNGRRRRWWCGPGPGAGHEIAEEPVGAVVMGSRSLNAHRNGLVELARTSQARRLASAAGSSGRAAPGWGTGGPLLCTTRRGTGRRRRR